MVTAILTSPQQKKQRNKTFLDIIKLCELAFSFENSTLTRHNSIQKSQSKPTKAYHYLKNPCKPQELKLNSQTILHEIF